MNQPGRPIFSYYFGDRSDRTKYRIKIHQRAEDGSERLWPQQFEVLIDYGEGNTERRPIRMNQADTTLWLDNFPQHILFNSDGLGYGVFPVDLRAARAAAGEVRRFDPSRITSLPDPVSRASAYINLYENMLRGKVSTPSELLDICRQALTREPEELKPEAAHRPGQRHFLALPQPRSTPRGGPGPGAGPLGRAGPKPRAQLQKAAPQGLPVGGPDAAGPNPALPHLANPAGAGRRQAHRRRLHRPGPGPGRARLPRPKAGSHRAASPHPEP